MATSLDPWSYASKTNSEHAEQVALFMWANMAERYGLDLSNRVESYTVPGYIIRTLTTLDKPLTQLKWLHAIANHGAGYGRAAAGVKAGVADIFLPVVKSRVENLHGNLINHFPFIYAGLYVELKRRKQTGKPAGKLSEEQKQFHIDMLTAGYQWELAYGWEQARDIIVEYLGLT